MEHIRTSEVVTLEELNNAINGIEQGSLEDLSQRLLNHRITGQMEMLARGVLISLGQQVSICQLGDVSVKFKRTIADFKSFQDRVSQGPEKCSFWSLKKLEPMIEDLHPSKMDENKAEEQLARYVRAWYFWQVSRYRARYDNVHNVAPEQPVEAERVTFPVNINAGSGSGTQVDFYAGD